jgi:hypothetical protein
MHAHVSTQILSGSIGTPETIQLSGKSPMLARAALPLVIAPSWSLKTGLWYWFVAKRFRAMELITILNRCHRFRGFVYQHASFSVDKKSIEVTVRPRKGSAAVCSRCHLPAPGYDQLAERRFEFIPLWGFLVFLLYTMRRVDCRRCGVVAVEEVPWGDGKRTLTRAYMLFLARWARRRSWKETAEAFRTSWDKVFDAVEHVVTWGLEFSSRTDCKLYLRLGRDTAT